MLSDNQFYFSLLRKYVQLFGNMFNNIFMVRLDENGNELTRIKVPIVFGPKEKYITRLEQDPDLNTPIGIPLPRMSFDITGINYAAKRKQNSLFYSKPTPHSLQAKTQYMGVPYDIRFTLSLYARNTDDANQIVEQILPYFNPDYTVTAIMIDANQLTRDIPIILDDIRSDTKYEGNFDTVRFVMWQLDFTMQCHFWGPITDAKLIRTVIINMFENSGPSSGGILRLNMNGLGANGDYKVGDTVYQGNTIYTATAFGKVNDWHKSNNKLIIGGYQGVFFANNIVQALSSNASYNLNSFDITPLQLVQVTITPDPITANVGDPYGYNTQILEYPHIS